MIFHYTFGCYVDAVDSDDAWEQVKGVSMQLDKIDAEKESAVECIEIFRSIEDTPNKPIIDEVGNRITHVTISGNEIAAIYNRKR